MNPNFPTDYVFGVPLARDFPRIHRNVNMTYYDYSINEENFSRELIRYWSNFIKTGYLKSKVVLFLIILLCFSFYSIQKSK